MNSQRINTLKKMQISFIFLLTTGNMPHYTSDFEKKS